MNKKIKRPKFDYKPNNIEEEEINSVIMHTIDLLEYRDRIIKHLKKIFFLFEQVKEEPKNVYGEFVIKDVSNFIQKIKSISKNISSSLFNEFFESSLVDYAEYLINLKNTTENKEFATEAKIEYQV